MPLLSLREAEKQTILAALIHTKGNREWAARILKCCKKTLYNKIVQYDLHDFSRRKNVPTSPCQTSVQHSFDQPVDRRDVGKG